MSDSRYIDFISAYCDRWCERCAFTERCSAFATQCAVGMCGDFIQALELAVGRPPKEDSDSDEAPDAVLRPWLDAVEGDEPTEEEIAQTAAEHDAQEARVENSSLVQAARAYTVLVHQWLQAEAEPVAQQARARVSSDADADLDALSRAMDATQVLEALEVVLWDHVLIATKLYRALDGLDDRQRGESVEDHPVQNDSNGSAKVALISIERSHAAWEILAGWTGAESPRMFADHLAQLRVEVEAAFPDARRFVRPGFDEPRTESAATDVE